jgi:hypothetical protein
LFLALLMLAGSLGLLPASDRAPAWAGQGQYRLLVKVDPSDTGARDHDEGVAELVLDWPAQLGPSGNGRRPDLRSLQVTQYAPGSGKPIPYGNYGYARGPFDRPFRWYDGSIPYVFPEFLGYASEHRGPFPRQLRVRAGYFYNALGEWKEGHLAWVHTQKKGEVSHYALYFDLLAPGQEPEEAEPRGWLGDGMQRCDERGDSTTGADHTLIAVDDWDNDGRVDIVFGEDYGHLFWFPNRGSRTEPRFPFYRMLSGADGLPLDAGFGASPLIVDWDGDGVKDLLVGTHWNRVLFFKNVGTNWDRKLAFRGFVQADGKVLELPHSPIRGGSPEVFKEDYYPVLEAVDWDGDGARDLLAGGYLTGRIYFFKNVGRAPDGQPLLTFRGPLEADGRPLNVGDWCAAPTVADFDGDGDLDLIAGNLPRTAGGAASDPSPFLRYYENVGTRQKPVLRERPFPRTGPFPPGSLACPRAVDWDGDGLLDLIVSARKNIYLFRNVGTRTQPRFLVSAEPLPARWGSASLPGTGAYISTQFLDWDRDGRLDLVSDYTVRLNSGRGNPGRYDRTESVLPAGEHIAHPSSFGDSWFFPRLYDLDQDGRLDVLFGDWSGHVWFHRNLSTGGGKHFDTTGYPLKLASGEPVKVGPVGKDPTKDFAAMQGARTVFTVGDFDRDGLPDLVVGDEYGVVRYFKNVGTKEAPAFAPAVEVANLRTRLMVDAVDWDRDGRLDILVGPSSGQVKMYRNVGGRGDARFDRGTELPVPPIMEPRAIAVDFNGDGDEDLFIPSTQGSCLVERSFLDHGYARARVLRFEQKAPR